MDAMAESGGNGGQRSGQSRFAAGANNPMAKTVALVVVALIVGIVLINIVGNGGSTAKTTADTTPTTTPGSTAVSTTPSTGHGATTTTKKPSAALVPPSQLQLIVVNSGAPAGSGGRISDTLRSRGYTKQTTTKKVTWTSAGLTVHCQPGLERERAALVTALAGVPNYPAKAGSWSVQPGISSIEQCYVAIGKVA